jgi:hypothetical protein
MHIYLTHFIPRLIPSFGAQRWASVHAIGLNGLLSRNHPESAKPRTFTRGASSDKVVEILSRLSKTPVAPALENADTKTANSFGIHYRLKASFQGTDDYQSENKRLRRLLV